MISPSTVPIFIISYNRLTYLRKLVEFLKTRKFQNIIILDNNSTYPPLLEYYSSIDVQVVYLHENFGHLVLWKSGKFEDLVKTQYFVLTDSDVVPEDTVPEDFLENFYSLLLEFPEKTKVGFGLRIDDLPEGYIFKKKVIEWENQFWLNQLKPNVYEADIDTTFALYRPNIYPDEKRWWSSLRTGAPYLAKHLSWYETIDSPNEERLFYQKSLNHLSSEWSITDFELLKEENTILKQRYKQLKQDHESLLNSNFYKYYSKFSKIYKLIKK